MIKKNTPYAHFFIHPLFFVFETGFPQELAHFKIKAGLEFMILLFITPKNYRCVLHHPEQSQDTDTVITCILQVWELRQRDWLAEAYSSDRTVI